MSGNTPRSPEQLPLFADHKEPESSSAHERARQGQLPATTNPPNRVGPAAVTYIDSRSLLSPAAGFISSYKFTLNPYSGCGFGCEYCYARFFAPTLDEQETWGQWVKVKENAVQLLRKARKARTAARRLERGDAIYMSTVTDPYQPIEQKLGLTRAILEELIAVQPRLTVQTRSPIAARDIDLFKQFERIRVNFTITTDSEEVRLRYEPHCPAIEARLKAAEAVARAGVPIGVSVSPMLPIRDPESFARRLADLAAAEYVTQFFKPTRSRFSAGSSPEAIAKMKADNWTVQQYETVRTVLARWIGPSRSLLEGAEGYAPA
jgi:DNA repair photolyase